MKKEILSYLPEQCQWREHLHWYESISSTNDLAKKMANEGAPHGTVLIAGHQTGGRGRLGRSFSSPAGMGVYLSVILRPECGPEKLMHLTCACAVAMCNAVENALAFRPSVKWINDLVYEKKKLGGILTELSASSEKTDYAIVGIGINCRQTQQDFPAEIRDIATSSEMITGKPCDLAFLCASMICALWQMDQTLLCKKEEMMNLYRKDCITLGQPIKFLQDTHVQYGTAVDIDADGALIVSDQNGILRTVSSGEVSVRGMYGYI